MRSLMLTLGSFALTTYVVGSAFYNKKQFYPAVIYLTKSSPSMAVLYVQAFVFVYLLGKLMRKIFFGQLRAAEMEHLVERCWYAVTETCLAFTVFREDISTPFVAMFTILLFLKCFHWLTEDRVDYMERSPVISWTFHMRAIGLLVLLSILDFYFVIHAYQTTLNKGASVQMVFGFEYMILLLSVMSVGMRYVLHTLDSRRHTPWDHKAMCMLYVDLVIGFFRVTLYLLFVILLVMVHTFPLFIVRPVYMSLRAFKKSVQDVVLSRKAIRYMNTVFPNATEADLAASDNVCIICREEMTADASGIGLAKKLPCGHIFHVSCLRSWFQRQQTCPTCRMDILRVAAQTNQQRGQTPAQAQQANQQPPGGAAQPQGQAGQQAQPGHHPAFPMPMAFWMFAQQQQQQQQAQAQQAGTTDPNQPGPSTSSAPPPAANFGMFPPPWSLPPFAAWSAGMPTLSSSDMARMSTEELAQLEGHTRAALEARLAALGRIRTLVDAATLQMQAYTIAVENSGGLNPLGQAAYEGKKEGSNATDPKAASTESATTEKVETMDAANGETVTADEEEVGMDEVEVIRQRRLKRLQPQPSEPASNNASAAGASSASTDEKEKEET